MLDNLGAEDHIEGVAGIIKAALDVAGASVKTMLALFFDSGRGNVDSVKPVAPGSERSRVRSRSAAHVEDIEALAIRDTLDGVKLARARDLGAFDIFAIVERLNSLVHCVVIASDFAGGYRYAAMVPQEVWRP